jgi:hypothetical protein
MPRKHLFAIVVMLAAAGVAGLFAFTRTVELGQGAENSPQPDAAIAFRLDELGQFEASLRQQLSDAQDGAMAPAPAPATVYRRAAPAAAGDHEDAEREDHADEHDDDRGDEHDDEHGDDDEGRGGDDRDD